MRVKDIILMALAIIPAIVLCIYIYRKDKSDKEPAGLLVKLFIYGALMTVPATYAEIAAGSAIDGFFSLFGRVSESGVSLPFPVNIYYQLVSNIIGVALIEEGLKWTVLYFSTRKNKNFNSLFDGMIYSVFTSLGFACLENILYVFSQDTFAGGLSVAVMRFFLSVPGHMFFAVAMGYCYSLWHIYELAGQCERSYASGGIIVLRGEPINGRKWLKSSIIVSTLIHGMWDFLCSGIVSVIYLYVFVVLLYVYGFRYISKLSKSDNYDRSIALSITIRKYPEIREYLNSLINRAPIMPGSIMYRQNNNPQ